MRFVFRADASHQIGSGHVMRVTTIAEEAISRGIECCFVGSIDRLPWLSDRVKAMGFTSIINNPDEYVSDIDEDVLIIDSYTTSPHSQYNSLANWKMLVCVKDRFTPDTNADLFINQSLRDSENSSSNVLEGPNYSLIRKGVEKSNLSESSILKVLVSGGGSDPFGFVTHMINVLDGIDFPFEVHAFTNELLTSIREHNVYLYEIGPELDVIASQVDLVITTASTSSIEFIARELPTLISCVVDNQQPFYAELSELKYAHPIGVRNLNGNWNLDRGSIITAITYNKIREELRNNIMGVIDLLGPKRIVDEIESRANKGEVRR